MVSMGGDGALALLDACLPRARFHPASSPFLLWDAANRSKLLHIMCQLRVLA